MTVALIGMSTPTVSAALTTAWTPSLKTIDVVSATKTFSSLIKAVAKFEGNLQAYSVSEDPNLEKQVLLASNDISKSLEYFNTELKENYPYLTKEQQEAFKDVYLSLGSYLEKLADEANQIFNGEDGKAKVTFEVQEIGEIAPNLANQIWVGSAVVV
jgi:hypothetical protein